MFVEAEKIGDLTNVNRTGVAVVWVGTLDFVMSSRKAFETGMVKSGRGRHCNSEFEVDSWTDESRLKARMELRS